MRRTAEPFRCSSAWATISLPTNSSSVLERMRATSSATLPLPMMTAPEPPSGGSNVANRSEEHTSELQSLMRISYAVFCLKKKKHKPYESQVIITRHHQIQ